MSRWQLLLVPLLAAPALGLAPGDKQFEIPFPGKCGLVTRYAADRIPPECLTEATNLLLDDDLTISRRQGRTKHNATALTGTLSVRGLWRFRATDGTDYMVALSSNALFQSSAGGAYTAIPGLTGLSSTAEMQCVQTIGRLWCVNGTDASFSWDGSSTSPVSGMPAGNLVGAFRNRVLVANVSAGLTRVRLSGELDGTDWTVQVPGRSTTPANIDISGLNDGKPVTCLMGEFQGAYIIGRGDDLWGLYGNDRRDFALRNISQEVGCLEPKSVREKNNALYWLSKRGLEKYTGTTLTRVSDQIRPTIQEIIDAAGNSRTATDTSQADFELGTSTVGGSPANVSTTISPNSVVPSSFSFTHNDDDDFSVYDSTGFYFANDTIYALNNSGSVPASTMTSPAYMANSPSGIFAFASATSTAYDTGISTPIITCTYNLTFFNNGLDIINGVEISSFTVQFATSSYGTWGSAQVCAGSNQWPFPATSPTVPITFSGTVNGTARYVRAGFFIEHRLGYFNTMYDELTLTARTTGYFISQCRNPGTSITSWGNLRCNYTSGGGDVTFAVSTGTSCNQVTRTTATWTTQANNAAITVATAAYVAYRPYFDLDVGTDTPSLQDCTIEWNEGAARPPVASEVWRDRYLLFYTTSTASGAANDSAIVFDRGDIPTLWQSIPAYSALNFDQDLYIGDSGATGRIYLLNTGQDDDGTSYDFAFKTSRLDMGDWAMLKQFKTLYMVLESEAEAAQNIPLTCTYFVDGSTTSRAFSADANLDEAQESGIFVAKFPFDADEDVMAHWLEIRCAYTGAQGPVKIHAMRLVYRDVEYP